MRDQFSLSPDNVISDTSMSKVAQNLGISKLRISLLQLLSMDDAEPHLDLWT